MSVPLHSRSGSRSSASFSGPWPSGIDVQLPTPAYGAYLGQTATVLVTLAVMQYAGLGFRAPGEFDFAFLAVAGATFPLFTYLLTVVAANSSRIPQWERLVESE